MASKKTLLKKSFYLAGPISDVKDESYKKWREDLTSFLEKLGWKAIDPMAKYQGRINDFKEELMKLRHRGKWKEVKDFMEGFVLPHDRSLVKKSDVIIAYVPEYTIGTTREIALGYEWKKPILVVCTIPLPSNSLIGMATEIFKDFDELKVFLNKWKNLYAPKHS